MPLQAVVEQVPRRFLIDGLTRDLYIPAHLFFHYTQRQIFADVTIDGFAAVRHVEGEGISGFLFSLDNEAVKKESRNRD